jgi:hypothetical protein
VPTPTAPAQKEGDFAEPRDFGWLLPEEELARTILLR